MTHMSHNSVRQGIFWQAGMNAFTWSKTWQDAGMTQPLVGRAFYRNKYRASPPSNQKEIIHSAQATAQNSYAQKAN